MSRLIPVILILLLSAASSAHALEIADHPKLGVFIDEMLRKHKMDEELLNRLFNNANIRNDILEIIARPGEAQPWFKYKTRFLTREHVVRGKRFWLKNQQAIRKASRKYGVPGEIIVAIIGIETNYGRTLGRHRVIDALTTLFLKYPRRRVFFRKELENFLLLTKEQGLDPLSVKGSYTGAIGLPQFMPSSYRAYAVDQDGNGSADLARSRQDAIGSVANYFKVHGWKKDGHIVSHPRMDGDLYPWISDLGNKPVFSIDELAKYGVHSPKKTSHADAKVALISFKEKSRIIYRIVFHNFYVITRYNNSTKYALAVTELSVLLRKAYRSKN